jgi:hypothetical protein
MSVGTLFLATSSRKSSIQQLITALQVPPNDVVGDGKEATMGADRALDTRFLADAAHPLVRARRRVAGLAGPSALESARINVLAPAK